MVYCSGESVFSVAVDSVKGASVGDGGTVVGSALIGDCVVAVGEPGAFVHPTNIVITIKAKLVRDIQTPFLKALLLSSYHLHINPSLNDSHPGLLTASMIMFVTVAASISM